MAARNNTVGGMPGRPSQGAQPRYGPPTRRPEEPADLRNPITIEALGAAKSKIL